MNRIPARTDLIIDFESSETLDGSWQVLARSTGGGVMTAMVTGVTVMESGAGATRQVTVTGGSIPRNPSLTRMFLRISVRTE